MIERQKPVMKYVTCNDKKYRVKHIVQLQPNVLTHGMHHGMQFIVQISILMRDPFLIDRIKAYDIHIKLFENFLNFTEPSRHFCKSFHILYIIVLR